MTQIGIHEINSCEVCGNKKLASVLNLGQHPLCDDLVPLSSDRVCKEYPIDILYCDQCHTAHHHYQVPKQDLFPQTYHYRSRFTADVLNGMRGLVASCESRFGSLNKKRVLDVGCNDGSLLDFFRDKGASTFGIEPTGAFADAKEKGHPVTNEFLTLDTAKAFVARNGQPDFITFTNVFAHIENLPELLSSLRILMAPSTVVVIENHYLGSVLQSNQFDTFYHEHPRSYSYTSFSFMARTLGVQLLEVEFPSRYGGNIRVFLGQRDSYKSGGQVNLEELKSRESQFHQDFLNMSQKIDRWKNSKRDQLMTLFHHHGQLRAKAFPGRAAILMKLLGLTEKEVAAVYEKPGSLKIGHYVPGTRIPILSDHDLMNLENKTAPIINLAWHIPTEIRKYLADINYTGPVIDILKPDEFATFS